VKESKSSTVVEEDDEMKDDHDKNESKFQGQAKLQMGDNVMSACFICG
jgi:hypothetical protein